MGHLSTVKIKDNTGKEYKWVIEEELDKAYQIFSNGIITYIYKAGCYEIAGQLFSIETRNNDWAGTPQWFDYINIDALDRTIDWGYLEDDMYGCDFIYDETGVAHGV